MDSVSDPAPLRHDVFLSYSRRDREFAALLKKTLENYTPPAELGLPRRHPEVFRDETDFTGTDYPEALRRHLTASGKMIVICSPAARGSAFVDEEIRLFAGAHGAANIIPVLISGIPNNEATPDQQAELAFPAALLEMMTMPLAADFRGFDARRHRLHKGVFEGSWFKLLADIYGKERGEVEQREKRRRERMRRIWTAGVSAAMVILSGLTVWALYSRDQAVAARMAETKQRIIAVAAEKTAEKERDVAEKARANEEKQRKRAEQSAEAERRAKEEEQRQKQIAVTRQLAAQAELILNQQPNLLPVSVLLAIESMRPERRVPSLEGYQALRHGLALLPRQVGLLQHEGAITALSLSADGVFLATASREKDRDVLRVWEMESQSMRASRTYRHSSGNRGGMIRDIALSLRGRFLAVIHGGEIDIWEVNRKSQAGPMKLTGLRAPTRLRFSNNERWLAAIGNEGGKVQVWGVKGWKPRKEISGPAVDLAFTPDGHRLAVASRNAVHVWEMESGKDSGKCVLPQAEMVALNRNGTYVAASLRDRTAGVWKISTDEAGRECSEVARMAHQGRISTVSVSGDGRYLSTGGRDGTARLWSTAEWREVTRMFHEGAVSAAEFNPDIPMLVTVGADHTARLWQLDFGRIEEKVPIEEAEGSLVFGPDDYQLSHVSMRGGATIWDLDPEGVQLYSRLDQPLGPPEDGLAVSAVACSPNGRFLALALSDGRVHLWETANRDEVTGNKKLAEIAVDSGTIKAMAVSPTGDRIAVLADDGTIRFADGDGIMGPAFTAPDAHNVAFSPDGTRLAVAAGKQGIMLWDVKAGRGTVRRTIAAVLDLAFSPDGRYLALRLEKGYLLVWGLQAGRELAQIRHDGELKFMALSREGRHLAAAGMDGVVRIWSVPDGNEVARIVRESNITALAISPDGKRIATAGMDNTIRISDWWPKDMTTEACRRLMRNLSGEEWRKYLGREPYRKTCGNK